MGRWLSGLTAGMIALSVAAGTVGAQVELQPRIVPPPQVLPPGCLHKDQEATSQRERRLEAIQAMRMIEMVAAARIPPKRDLAWEELERSAALRSLRAEGGPKGDLARKIRWGEVEPLPGWRILWVIKVMGPTFSLTDVWDPCRFTLSSEDPEVMGQRPPRIVPLDTTE